MEFINVLLISTKLNVEKKVELVLNLLDNNKLNYKIFLYTNKQINNIKNIEVNVLNENKNELINLGLSKIKDNVVIINLDYSLKTIKNNLNNILENFESYDIINFKEKESKTKNFFTNILFRIYNFFLMFFNKSNVLNISKDFQYLSGKVTKVIYNCNKSPNYMRLFENFKGLNVKTIEFEKEKIKYKTNLYFIMLAIILVSLVIISLGVFIPVLINFNASPNISKVIIVEIICVSISIILTFASLTYNKYLNSI
ncbi:MAG: hypothetical protein E7359_03200 [Clostridiales bacterium]|nr:hypothetical protein [Clostridiales bacterium]